MAQSRPSCKISFRVRAETSFGDSLVVVGSGETLGSWDPQGRGVALTTTPEDYPVWTSSPLEFQVGPGTPSPEYKYVRLAADGSAEWEADGANRQVPSCLGAEAAAEKGQLHMIMDDGDFGKVLTHSFGFDAGCRPAATCDVVGSAGGPSLLILGDSITAGHGAWRYRGWAAQLCGALRDRFGYSCRSAAEEGAHVWKALSDFPALLGSSRPSVVVLGFSGGVQRLASCPEWELDSIGAEYIKAMEDLIAKVWQAGALPVVAGLCPHGDLQPEHADRLKRTSEALRQFGVPVLDWYHAVASSSEQGRWAEGLCHDAAHPNTEGHRRLFTAANLSLFDPSAVEAQLAKRRAGLSEESVVFSDGCGFEVRSVAGRSELIVVNSTQNSYELNGGWHALQEAFAAARREAPWSLRRGLYLTTPGESSKEAFAAIALDSTGRVAPCARASVPGGCRIVLSRANDVLDHREVQKIYYDTKIGVLLCRSTGALYLLNEADCEYNVHPMWNDVRVATRSVPEGVYEDGSGQPFRTAVVSVHGLQSRVKVPSGSALQLKRIGPLSSIERVAVLPLGDRCSIRMLMHKIEFDGPCYPFDLTRTTSLADVADIIATGFEQMWYEELLEYDHDAGRIFHRKWGGLSYAHEVEDGDDPVCHFQPVVARMAKRYAGRAARFDFSCKHADKVLFMRTGVASRGEVENLLQRVHARYPGLKASLLLISDQPTEEFNGMPSVKHIREHFDPDRMYEDLNYWMNSAHRFRGILQDQGIDARSLYWCPNNLKEAEKEMNERAVRTPPVQAWTDPCSVTPVPGKALMTRVDKFSHSCLFEVEARGSTAAAASAAAAAASGGGGGGVKKGGEEKGLEGEVDSRYVGA